MVRVIVAGTRNAPSALTKHLIDMAISYYDITPEVIVSGVSGIVDMAGITYAKEHNIKTDLRPADWDAHGKAAGPIRNKLMAQNADALLLIWNGKSRGSRNMRQEALNKGLTLYEVKYSSSGVLFYNPFQLLTATHTVA